MEVEPVVEVVVVDQRAVLAGPHPVDLDPEVGAWTEAASPSELVPSSVCSWTTYLWPETGAVAAIPWKLTCDRIVRILPSAPSL